MKPGQCLLCIKSESEYIANKVVKKELTHQQAANELGVGLPEWVSHYELHVRNKLVTALSQDIEGIKDNFLDKVKTAHDSLDRLIKTTEGIHKRIGLKENQDNTKLIMAYATLEKNVISGLKECAILEGDISAATTINIQNNTIKVDKLMAVVLEVAPPETQRLILQKMDELVEN